jgi:hypothetical protein
VAGASITPAVSVRIYDEFDNFVDTATNSVSLEFGTNAGSGTLSGGTAVAAVDGVATFSALSVNNAAIGYTLVASSSALTASPASTAFEITAGALNSLVWAIEPMNGGDYEAGENLGPLVVVAQDLQGNRIEGISVQLLISNDASYLEDAFLTDGSAIDTDSSGEAAFNSPWIDKVGDGYTLIARNLASAIDSLESVSFNIYPSDPSYMIFDVQPEDTIAGISIAPAVKVHLLINMITLLTTP